MQDVIIRKPQLLANWLFKHFSSWRALIGLAVIAVLSTISITLNFQLGKLMGSDEITKRLFPIGFGVLDVAALFLASWITIKSASAARKAFAWVWFAYLLGLSVWAAMSFTLASDARLVQSGYDMMRDAKLRALEQAEQEVSTAQRNYENTTEYKQLRKGELVHAKKYRDKLIKEVGKLNSEKPHVSLAIYYRTSALLAKHAGVKIKAEDLSSIVRMLWALALTLSPFVITALLAFEILSADQEDDQETGSPGRLKLSLGSCQPMI